MLEMTKINCRHSYEIHVTWVRVNLSVSRIALGCMSFGVPKRGTHPWSLDEENEPAVYQAGARTRHQFLRHGQRLFRRHERGDRRPRAARFRQARRNRSRDESFLPDAPMARMAADFRARRSWPRSTTACDGWAWITSISTRFIAGMTKRRSKKRSKRCTMCQSWQSALHRRFVDVCVAIRQSALPRRRAMVGRGSSRCRITTTCSTAKRSAR